MIENDKHIQDWADENKQALLQFIKDNLAVATYTDICVAGSRVYWNNYATADFDILIYSDEENLPENKFFKYSSISMSMRYIDTSKKFDLVLNQYNMPWYSLVTGEMKEGVEADWIALRAWRNKP